MYWMGLWVSLNIVWIFKGREWSEKFNWNASKACIKVFTNPRFLMKKFSMLKIWKIDNFPVSRLGFSTFHPDVKKGKESDIFHNGEVSVKPEAPCMEIRDEDESNLTWEKGFEDLKHSKFNILQFPFLSSPAIIGETFSFSHFSFFLDSCLPFVQENDKWEST